MNYKIGNPALIQMSGCLILKNLLKNKICFKALECNRQMRTNSCTFRTFQLLGEKNPQTLNKTLLNISKKQMIVVCSNRNSSNSMPNQTFLMDTEIKFVPNFINWLKMFYLYYFKVKDLIEGFSFDEFTENTKTALEVVTNFISQSNFSELEGLLTNECKSEVEKNVAKFSTAQRISLAINVNDIFKIYPYDMDIITVGDEKERIFLKITMVYFIMNNLNRLMKSNDVEMFDFIKSGVVIYNCRFIRECTKGVNGHWTIDCINLYKEPIK